MATRAHELQPDTPAAGDLLAAERRGWHRSFFQILFVGSIVLLCAAQTGLLDAERLAEGGPAMGTLVGEMVPPDFSNAAKWVKPVFDTLAMSIAGTALAVLLSLPLGFLAARNTSPNATVY